MLLILPKLECHHQHIQIQVHQNYKKTFEINCTPDEPYIRTGYIDISFKLDNIDNFEKFLNANKQIQKVTESQWLSIKEEVS